jgi:iron(III) transport system substrate-binding protein
MVVGMGCSPPSATPAAAPTSAPVAPTARPAAAATSAPAPAQAANAAAPAGNAQGGDQVRWEQTVAAARQEGTVILSTDPGQIFRDWANDFQKAYPGITLEVSQANAPDWIARVTAERQSGNYLWDVYVGGSSTVFPLEKAGGLEPLKSNVLQPGLTDDSLWLGGFDAGFTDESHAYIYNLEADRVPKIYVNRDIIPVSELTRVEDLTDPKWVGKISMYDPRIAGKAASNVGDWLMNKGDTAETFWRTLLATEPVVTKDRRQQLQWVVNGEYPIAMFASNTSILDFQNQGLGLNVKPLAPESEMGAQPTMAVDVALINRAPHPNAARVFLAWILSQDGQTSFGTHTGSNSRRLDVPIVAPDQAEDPKDPPTLSINQEWNGHYIQDGIKITLSILGQ